MTVYELNRDELTELKLHYYSKSHPDYSYSEMASINSLVSDKEIFEEYDNTTFTQDDFFCNSDNKKINEEEEVL